MRMLVLRPCNIKLESYRIRPFLLDELVYVRYPHALRSLSPFELLLGGLLLLPTSDPFEVNVGARIEGSAHCIEGGRLVTQRSLKWRIQEQISRTKTWRKAKRQMRKGSY